MDKIELTPSHTHTITRLLQLPFYSENCHNEQVAKTIDKVTVHKDTQLWRLPQAHLNTVIHITKVQHMFISSTHIKHVEKAGNELHISK